MAWTIAQKNALLRTLVEFWPRRFTDRDGTPTAQLVGLWAKELARYTHEEVERALATMKAEAKDDRAPELPQVHAAVARAAGASSRPGTFPPECCGVIVRGLTSGHVWEAASTGAYGPNAEGRYHDDEGRPYFWPLVARRDHPREALPEGVYQAILRKGRGLKASASIPELAEREYTAEEVAENDDMWKGRIDHPDPEMARIYQKMRAGMRRGKLPAVAVREPGED